MTFEQDLALCVQNNVNYFSRQAYYMPLAGVRKSINVIEHTDSDYSFQTGYSQISKPEIIVDILRSDAPDPKQGESIQFASEKKSYKLDSPVYEGIFYTRWLLK